MGYRSKSSLVRVHRRPPTLYRRERRKHFGPTLRDVPKTLSDPRLAPQEAQFMLDTGLLDQFNTFRFRSLFWLRNKHRSGGRYNNTVRL
jgi:hypothetical protein